MRRALASITLLTLLACSSAGVCWTVLVRSGHECCDTAESMAPAKGCASSLEPVGQVTFLAPSETGALTPRTFSASALLPVSPSAPELHGPAPPLVLRV
jgi:hypothetical protein